MSKKIDFLQSLKELDVEALQAKIKEDELRMKKLTLLMPLLHWKIHKASVL